MIDTLKKSGVVLLACFSLFAFTAMLVGPSRVAPWFEQLLGIRSPQTLLAEPVARAQEYSKIVGDFIWGTLESPELDSV